MNIADYKRKMRSNVRQIIWEVIDEDKASKSLLDTKNTLRVIRDPQNKIWKFRYKSGGLPPALQGQQFTSIAEALKHAGQYFQSRGLKIVGMEDIWTSELEQ